MGRSLRLAFTLLSAVCVWLWGGLAEAHSFEAPQCDARAATTFGQSPVLQPLLATLDEVPANESGCFGADADDVSLQQGHPLPSAAERHAPDPVTLPAVTDLPRTWFEPVTTTTRPQQWLMAQSAHVRSLERPPR